MRIPDITAAVPTAEKESVVPATAPRAAYREKLLPSSVLLLVTVPPAPGCISASQQPLLFIVPNSRYCFAPSQSWLANVGPGCSP